MSPRLPPLPAQLEPEESTLDLDRWDESPAQLRQRRKPREYELSSVNHSGTSASPAPVSHHAAEAQPQINNRAVQQHAWSAANPPSSQSNELHDAEFHTPSSEPDSQGTAVEPSGHEQRQTQDFVLDSMFPSIKKIMPGKSNAQHPNQTAQARPSGPHQDRQVRCCLHHCSHHCSYCLSTCLPSRVTLCSILPAMASILTGDVYACAETSCARPKLS